MQHGNRWVLAILFVAGLQLVACRSAPATAAGSGAPARLESIEGSDLKRVVLTEKAAERLAIQTATVREEPVARTRVIGGQVVSSVSGAVLRVRATPDDLQKVDRLQPARVRPLGPRNGFVPAAARLAAPGPTRSGLIARASEPPAGTAADPADPALYYVVDGAEHGLAVGQRVLLELPLSGGEPLRKVVPYSAVFYDVRGDSWTYTQPAPLTFVRHRVTVDYIDGDRAVLSDGPPAGTEVVTVGATELSGTEVTGGK
jgi:hypothetical protein